MSDLESRLEAALRAGNRTALIGLYEEAAAQAQDDLHRSFFLTHAYVHALEAGDERAAGFKAQLMQMGSER